LSEIRKAGIAAAVVMALFAVSCNKNNTMVPDTVEPLASLTVSFSPNPGQLIKPGVYKYTITLAETAGVGVSIYGYQREVFSDAGVLEETFDGDQLLVESWFRDCGGEGNYVPPSGVRCTRLLSTRLEPVANAGYMIWTFFGVDDTGNEVIGRGRIELN
jgi:hypothetical protein